MDEMEERWQEGRWNSFSTATICHILWPMFQRRWERKKRRRSCTCLPLSIDMEKVSLEVALGQFALHKEPTSRYDTFSIPSRQQSETTLFKWKIHRGGGRGMDCIKFLRNLA